MWKHDKNKLQGNVRSSQILKLQNSEGAGTLKWLFKGGHVFFLLLDSKEKNIKGDGIGTETKIFKNKNASENPRQVWI